MPIYRVIFEDLVKSGHNITIVTSFPHYRKGRRETWKRYRGKLFQVSNSDGIRLIRSYIFAPVFKNNRLSIYFRALNFISFNISSLFAAIFLGGKTDVIFAPSSPPLTNGIIASFAGFLKNCPMVYNVQDLYPDMAINMDLIKNKSVLRILRTLEIIVYNLSSMVLTISKRMADLIEKKGISPRKIAIISNSIDTAFIKPGPKINSFSKKFKISNSFVIMYAGNIGIPHGVEVLVKAAELLKGEKDVVFCFVARGENKDKMRILSRNKNLTNVLFIPPQPEKLVSKIWASASVGVITYRKNLAGFSVPSKLFAMMCAARPVIASLDDNSEAAHIVKKSNCGVVVSPEDEGSLADAVKRIKDNPALAKMQGHNGREYVEKYLHRNIISKRYEILFKSICNSNNISETL